MDYRVDDWDLGAEEFLAFVQQVWPGEYDPEKTQAALEKTINLTAYEGETLAGCLRILTDGCFFGTITELLVRPEYQRRGLGSHLLRLAAENTPTMLYFGAQPGLEGFYEKTAAAGACSPMSSTGRKNKAAGRNIRPACFFIPPAGARPAGPGPGAVFSSRRAPSRPPAGW